MKTSFSSKLVNCSLFFLGLWQAVSGLVLMFVFEKGRGEEQVFIVAKHTWKLLHGYIGLVFIVLMAVHVFLHWQWFKANICPFK